MTSNILTTLKSILKKPYVFYLRKLYSYLENKGEPIIFHLPKGMVISLYPKGQIAESLYKSKYEYDDISLVISYLKAGMNVLDIGANIGIYSIVADKIVGPTGHVWAFEPSKETYNRLLANLSLNKTSSVEPVNIALSDIINSSLMLKRDPGYPDGERYLSIRKEATSRVSVDSNDFGDNEIVTVSTLDHYMHARKGGCPRIDFIKMDVEGVEYNVFRGAQQLLINNHDILLFFECTRQGCELSGHRIEDVFNYLRQLGFNLYGWRPKSKAWDESEEYLKDVGNLWACRYKKNLPCL